MKNLVFERIIGASSAVIAGAIIWRVFGRDMFAAYMDLFGI